jgi:cytochrome c-type biogenesis protein CcmH/NrfG
MSICKSNYLLAVLIIILLTGCAANKPVVKNYPPPSVYDRPISTGMVYPEEKTSSDTNNRLIAVISPLKCQALEYLADGDIGKAEATVERAIAISPNNAELWSLLAKIQLTKGNWNQAKQLAAKSNLLAGENRELKAKNWQIIAEALEHQ